MVTTALASFSGPQDALDARRTTPRGTCYIGGVVTPYIDYSISFRVGQTATGRITLPLPRPDWVQPNADVVIEGGHNDLVGTLFAGFIPRLSFAMTARGDTLELTLVGQSRRLVKPFRDDMTWQGPVDAGQVFSDICDRAGVPSYIAHAALFPSGTTLTLGGNPNVDDGTVVIEANSSPLGQFQRLVKPYAYAVTDTPSGAVLFHRVLGTPSGSPVVTFREGQHLGDTRRTYDVAGIVNVWDVQGVTYTDAYGGQVPIRSVADPSEVEPHPEVPGDGYSYEIVTNSDIVRPDQADAARNVAEIKRGAADAPVTWAGVAVPFVAPGDVVELDAETVEGTGLYWLDSLDIEDGPGGHMATYTGVVEAGEEYPGIVDRTTIDIETGIWHGGDEYVAHYANKAAQGTYKGYFFTLPERVTVANVRGLCHSWNSQTVAGEDTDLTVTRWEVWEAGKDWLDDEDQPVSSGTMPQMDERYFSRLTFDPTKRVVFEDGSVKDPIGFYYWSPFAINLRSLDAGDYWLVIKCGEKAGIDDGEIANVYLELFGLVVAAGG